MKHFKSLRDAYPAIEALSSEVRMEIIELLQKHNTLNLDAIAKNMHLSNGALTGHIKKLENAGIVKITTVPGRHGSQKQCSLAVSKLVVEFGETMVEKDSYTFELGIGHYCAYNVLPPSGIADARHIIGEVNDARYFDYPERFDAGLLWFSVGYCEYKIPNALKPDETASALSISFEISGFAGLCDVDLEINGKKICSFTAPKEHTGHAGLFSPIWWHPNLGQYGSIKTLTIDKSGSFLNGAEVGETTIGSLFIEKGQSIVFRLSTAKNAKNNGGIMLFGKSFGDHNSGIRVNLCK